MFIAILPSRNNINPSIFSLFSDIRFFLWSFILDISKFWILLSSFSSSSSFFSLGFFLFFFTGFSSIFFAGFSSFSFWRVLPFLFCSNWFFNSFSKNSILLVWCSTWFNKLWIISAFDSDLGSNDIDNSLNFFRTLNLIFNSNLFDELSNSNLSFSNSFKALNNSSMVYPLKAEIFEYISFKAILPSNFNW